MANPEWTDPSDFDDRPTRAQLGVDGNCGFALLGDDLATGEAEFEEIRGYIKQDVGPGWYSSDQGKRAAKIAYERLKARIDYPISYYLTESYPGAG